MTLFNANMIKNFPGSDDSRGTTTRINYSIPFPEDATYSPEMRPDEFPGPLGEILRTYNLTRQTLSACQIVEVDTLKDLNEVFDGAVLDNINGSIVNLNNTINDKIVELSTAYGEIYNFTITKLDIVKNYTNTSGLHNQAGVHSVFVTWNYDVIIYGQFSPNPLQQPNPEPLVCSTYINNSEQVTPFNNEPVEGIFYDNDNYPALPAYSIGFRTEAAMGVGNNGEGIFTGLILQDGQTYTLFYNIKIGSFSAGNQTLIVAVNSLDVFTFSYSKENEQTGYIPFVAPVGSSGYDCTVSVRLAIACPAGATTLAMGRSILRIGNSYCAS